MTTYAARHVALGGDDSEPEALASSGGAAPRRAIMPEVAVTSYQPHEPEPELGLPVVAHVPSQTMEWYLAVASKAPRDPGPVHATTPVTVEGPMADPASFPTPVSHFATVSYQSMPSPSPYASAPAQGYVPAMASPCTVQMSEPYSAGDPTRENVVVVGTAAVAVAGDFHRSFGLINVGIVLAGVTVAGVAFGGTVWWAVAFAWALGIFALTRITRPGRV